MARFDVGWCQFPRNALPVTRRDPLATALLATLCSWATPDSANKIGKAKIGEVLTSDEELAAELGCDRKTISRKLKKLAEFITLSRDGKRGRIISVNHLVPKMSQTCPENSPSQILDPQGLQENLVPKMSQTCPEVDPYSRKREREKGGEEDPPRKSHLNMESDTGNKEANKKSSEALPEQGNRHKQRWVDRINKLAKTLIFTPESLETEILKMHKLYTWQQLDLILSYLETASSKIAQKFISPFDYSKKFFDEGIFLEVAYREAITSPEGRAQETRRIVDEKEKERKRVQETDAIKRSENRMKIPPGGLLKLLQGDG